MIKVLYNTVNITEKKAHIVKYSQQITELKKKKTGMKQHYVKLQKC